jgi:hypothetical protein
VHCWPAGREESFEEVVLSKGQRYFKTEVVIDVNSSLGVSSSDPHDHVDNKATEGTAVRGASKARAKMPTSSTSPSSSSGATAAADSGVPASNGNDVKTGAEMKLGVIVLGAHKNRS